MAVRGRGAYRVPCFARKREWFPTPVLFSQTVQNRQQHTIARVPRSPLLRLWEAEEGDAVEQIEARAAVSHLRLHFLLNAHGDARTGRDQKLIKSGKTTVSAVTGMLDTSERVRGGPVFDNTFFFAMSHADDAPRPRPSTSSKHPEFHSGAS